MRVFSANLDDKCSDFEAFKTLDIEFARAFHPEPGDNGYVINHSYRAPEVMLTSGKVNQSILLKLRAYRFNI